MNLPCSHENMEMHRRVARYNRKRTPTSPKPPYVIFNAHTQVACLSSLMVDAGPPWVQIATIDPGIVNFCLRIERRCGDGTTLTLVQDKYDFTQAREGESLIGVDSQHYMRMVHILAPLIPLLTWCHYIVIESQMPINYDMVRMGQHIITFCLVNVSDQGLRPLIVEIDPRFKSTFFGAPKMTKPQLKIWAWKMAVTILEERGDAATASMIKKCKKKDDHGDTVCYAEAWWQVLQQGAFTAPVTATMLLAPSPVNEILPVLPPQRRSRLVIVKL